MRGAGRRAPRCFALVAIVVALGAVSPRPALASETEELYARALDLCWRGRDAESLPIAERVLDLARRSGDRSREAWTLNLIGDCHFGLGRWSDANASFEAALPVMREVGDRLGEATVLKNVAITCRYVGRFDDGLACLFQALEIYRQLDDPMSVVSALANLGQAYANVGATRFAFEAYQEGLRVAAERADACDAGMSIDLYVRLGFLFADVGDLERSLEHFRRAQTLEAGFTGYPDSGKKWMLEGLSCTLDALGQKEEAIALRRECLEMSRRMEGEADVAATLGGLAGLVDATDPDLAMRYRHEALEIVTRNNPQTAWGAHLDLGRAYRARGDLERGVEHFQRAVDLLEAVRSRLGAESYRSLFYTRHQHYYEELVETLVEREARAPGRGDDARAFAVLEQAKARAMLDAIAEAKVDAEASLTPAQRERQDRLGARAAELRARLLEDEAPADARRQWFEELGRVEEEFDTLVAEIRRENPRYAAIRYPEPLSLEAARALVGPDTALVAYMATRTRVVGFLVTADAFAAVPLEVAPGVLAARVRNYTDLLATGEGDEWRDIGRRLYADLLAPFAERIARGVTRLVVVPDGVLYELPFETLEGPSGRFLIEDFTVSYAPSATVLAELRDPGRGAASDRADMLVVADPASASAASEAPGERLARSLYEDERLSVGPIPSTRTEAEAIARLARPGSLIFTGADASERNVKAARLDGFRVLHFATHGLVSERAPYRSALVLAHGAGDGEDGFLQAREIYRLKLRADLVVLSACQTARGAALGGEGVQSLARAFMHAGARSVVASLWNVNDERTAVFMERFYGHLAGGATKADALRSAKLEMLADPATASPRTWAAFVLVGEASEPVPIGAPRRWGWWLAGAAALALGAFAARRALSTQSRPR